MTIREMISKERDPSRHKSIRAYEVFFSVQYLIPFSFVADDLTIEILSGELDENKGMVSFTIRVLRDGNELAVSNPFIFHNPPTMVPDGTKKTRIMKDGTEILVDNFKEDLPEALRQIIVEAVRVSTKKS